MRPRFSGDVIRVILSPNMAGQPGSTGLLSNVARSRSGSRADELCRATMNDTAESAAIRLWRDRAQLREQERNEAQLQARVTQERLASLTSENARLAAENGRLRALNDRLAAENARLQALLTPEPGLARAQTEREMEALRSALLALLADAGAEPP